MKIFYKPSYFYLIIDLLILILSLYVVLDWFPLTTNSPFTKYSGASFWFIFSWFIFSYLLKRYKPLRKQQYFVTSLRLFYVSSVNFVIFVILIHYFFKPYSGYVLLAITVGTFLINYIVLSCYFAYKFAVDYNEVSLKPRKQRIDATVKLADKLDSEAYAQLEAMIYKQSAAVGLRFLTKQVDLSSGNTSVFISNSAADLKKYPVYQYDTIVQLERLNNMREINKKLAIINEKLPDNGIFVCCFESKSTRKKRILKNNPGAINYILYMFDFLFKRVMPKFILTKWLYYYITGGNNRIFSKAEVLGRLYCSGFKVILEKKIGQLTYVIAQRAKEPETIQKRIYGPLIRLTRYGKDGEMIKVYKMRTMHPFSEYLQGYIYKRNSLNVDGKFNRDIRITTIGSFMRKYWIDELPMFINLFNGEMKLVGVRPLSQQYYSLYNSDLQEKRLKFKPGLLPPFYADLPHSLDEIQDSEMRYLVSCESKGVFKTDLIYFFRILKNILINNARSG